MIKINRLNKIINKMNIVYAQEKFPNEVTKSIFLAGPTSRENKRTQWRLDAIDILNNLNYDGTLFIPEIINGKFNNKYDEQVEWESNAMNRADIIVFYIPRDKDNLALTTNVEFGEWYKSGKIVVGFPKDSIHNSYIQNKAESEKLTIHNTLEDTLKEAVNIIGDGAYRKDDLTLIPLEIYKTNNFQKWYNAQHNVGNKILMSKYQYIYKALPDKKFLFLWILYMKIYIKAEDRIKGNELVISRPDISSVLMYLPNKNLMKTKIILVKEFRNPVKNSDCFTYELPGGSSKISDDPLLIMKNEIKEETDLDIDKSRIIQEQTRQCTSTLNTYSSHLFSVKLTNDDISQINKSMKNTHGVIEDTEKTYVLFETLENILDNELVDWSNVGMILSVLNK